MAVSAANSLAIAATVPKGWPASLSHAALSVRSRAASIAVAMSASIHCTIWCWPIGTPKDLRSRAYATASSHAPAAIPTAWAAIPMRPPSSAPMAILKPMPSPASRFPTGTRQSSKTNSAVSEARRPSLSSTRGTPNPGVPFSIRRAEMPWCPVVRSVWQKTRAAAASRPFVTKSFRPLTT